MKKINQAKKKKILKIVNVITHVIGALSFAVILWALIGSAVINNTNQSSNTNEVAEVSSAPRVRRALSAPSSYDKAYAYYPSQDYITIFNSSGYISKTSSTYPFFNRVVSSQNSSYYDFYFTDYEIVSGMKLSMTISLTTMDYFDHALNALGEPIYGKYVPFESSIGSSYSNGQNRVYISLENKTGYQYLVYYDFSPSSSPPNYYYRQYDYENNIIGVNNLTIGISNNVLNQLPLFNRTKSIVVSTPYFSGFHGFSGLYLKQLSEDTSYNDGYTIGYVDGHIDGEDIGYDIGYADGYDFGFDLGIEQGELATPFSLIRGAFVGIGGILDIQIFPNISLGAIMFIPLMISIIFAIMKAWKS